MTLRFTTATTRKFISNAKTMLLNHFEFKLRSAEIWAEKSCDMMLKNHTFVMLCAIWYNLYNLKNVKNAHGGVVLLLSCRLKPYNFIKSNTPPWVFFRLFQLKMIPNRATHHIFRFKRPDKFDKHQYAGYACSFSVVFIFLLKSASIFQEK